MKAPINMSEPISGTAAGVFGWKFIGGLAGLGAIGAGLASIVVMCLMTPRNPREWAVGIICTIIGSVCGGCAFIQHYGLQDWAQTSFGLIGMVGIIFTCGLPGWAIVRWTFNYINKSEGKTIAEVVHEIKDAV